MKNIISLVGVVSCLFHVGCASAGSIKKINTLGGDSFNAIVLVSNIWENVEIADTGTGFRLYASMNTNNNARPGSLLIYTDGIKNEIISPSDWDLDDISVSRYGTSRTWSVNSVVSNDFLNSMVMAAKVTIKIINSNGLMWMGDGLDISGILPKIKKFIGS
jgi:hypothetical protein